MDKGQRTSSRSRLKERDGVTRITSRSRSRSTSPLRRCKIESEGNSLSASIKDLLETATYLTKELERSTETLKTENKQLSDELHEARKELTECKHALEEKTDEVEKQQKEIKQVTQRLDLKIRSLGQCEAAYNHNKKKVERQQTEIESLRREVQDLRTSKNTLDLQGEVAEDVPPESRQKTKDQELIDKLKNELRARDQLIKSLTKKVSKIQVVLHGHDHPASE